MSSSEVASGPESFAPVASPVIEGEERASRATLILFTTCVFSGAAVLFVVEPMVAKLLLPLAGGTAAVWTTSVLFFQLLLTAGYVYTHGISQRWSPRLQVVAHLALMLAVLLVLPITVRQPGPAPNGTPVFWLLGVLMLSVGLPFFVVSTTSPLLQRWLSMTRDPHARDPYFLYQASNVGSLLALLAYPTLIESRLGLSGQRRLWTVAYVGLVVLAALAARHLWRHHSPALAPVAAASQVPAATSLTRVRRARWVLLAAVPSIWMLGVTAYFTTAVRPLPLLWVIPLALYLLSFALVFGPRPLPTHLLHRAFPFIAVPLLGFVLLGGSGPFWALAILHLGAFLVGALICHGLLAADRPPARHLTEFYVWLSIGGALGGLFTAIAAPLVFNDYLEYPIAIIAACFLRPTAKQVWTRVALLLDLRAAGALLAVLLVLAGLGWPTGFFDGAEKIQLTAGATGADLLRTLLVLPIPAVVAIAFSGRQVRFGSAALVMLVVSLLPIGTRGTVLFQERDFYGIHTVITDPARTRHLLIDGITIHGVQVNDPALHDVPSAYYTPSGPVGDVFGADPAAIATWRVGVIGLGSGAMSCYALPGQHWTYYELDWTMVKIARDPRLFTFLRDCPGGGTDIVVGDGRLSLQAAPAAQYDLLAIDAFGSDAVPTHLLTTQAIQLYLGHLRPGGLLLFNISNKYLDLRPVLAADAAALGLEARERIDTSVTAAEGAAGKFPSAWIVLARPGTIPVALSSGRGWAQPPTKPDIPAWTDDYSNVLRITRFS